MKRTISMILVAVMMILSLVSCGYSIANEDISLYATLSQEDKTKFESALKNLLIEDGDFTTDPELRSNKLWDALYSALAGTVSEDDKITEGKPSGNDLVYYSYYCTAKFGEETVTLYTSNMKTPVNVQLGLKDPTDLQEKLTALFDIDFTDKTYEATTSGLTKEGDLAFVTYTYTYTQKGENGVENDVVKTVTNALVVIGDEVTEGDTAKTLASKLNGQTVNKTLDNFEIEDKELGNVKYTNVKINWVASGAELASFTDVTYDEKTTVTDTNGVSRNLKDVELTYHIYPVGFVKVPEYNATNVMNEILSSDITSEIFYELAFGRDFVGNGDEDKKYTEEQRNAILDKYKDIAFKEIVEKVDDNGNKTYKTEDKTAATLEDLIIKIAAAQTVYASAESTYDKAKTSLEEAEAKVETAEATLKSAQEAYDKKVKEEGEDKATSEKQALEKAQASLDSAKEALEGKKNDVGALVGGAKNTLKDAEEALNRASDNRKNKIDALFSLDNGAMEKKIADGYKKSTELYLSDVYDSEIKMNVAKEVYYFLRQYVKVNAYPEDAIEETYDQLIQNYKYKFYNEDYGDTKISNYKQYEKSFEKYLIATVKADLAVTVDTYEAAIDALRENAKTYVEPILVIYAAAKAYDVVVTDEEYEEYKEELGAGYDNYLSAYGDNSFRYACQFDKLVNHFVNDGDTTPELDGEVSYNDFITYTFGTPASSVEDTDDGEDEGEDDHDHDHDHDH